MKDKVRLKVIHNIFVYFFQLTEAQTLRDDNDFKRTDGPCVKALDKI